MLRWILASRRQVEVEAEGRGWVERERERERGVSWVGLAWLGFWDRLLCVCIVRSTESVDE